MTRENAAKLWEVIKAYGEGKEIEHDRNCKWQTCEEPCFDRDFQHYRIAPPKPKEFWIRECIFERGHDVISQYELQHKLCPHCNIHHVTTKL